MNYETREKREKKSMKYKELHEGTSFPVGKVSFLDLHPLSFGEFLRAMGKEQLEELLSSQNWPWHGWWIAD